MRTSTFLRSRLPFGLAAFAASLPLLTGYAGASTNGIWFSGREIFPIDNQIGQLHAADFNGDALNDLIVVNNSRSKITLLYNQTGATNPAVSAKPARKRELNELPPDARFRVESIASEKRIAALTVADLNQDGRPDIAYYGEPKELVVQYNQGENDWSPPKRFPIEDGQLSPNALTAGDLNGDGRVDLLLLSESHLYLLAPKFDQSLGEPEKIPFSGTVRLAQAADLNGDGRNDLLLVNWDSPNPFRFRLQNSQGQLGPELYFSLPAIRSYCADQLTGDKETQIVTIALNSGRAQLSHFTRKPAEVLAGSFRQGQLHVLPLNKTDKARRGLVWADVDGNQLPDLLVAEPESGQISVSFQEPGGPLAPPKLFPTLTGVSDLAVADWDNDGKTEIFLLSSDERQVGVARLDGKKRIPFPTLIPMEGKPLAMTAGVLQAGAKATLAVILDQDGKRALLTRTADGKSRTQKLNENFKSNPSTLAIHDVDQDGLPDLVVLIPYEKIKVLRQVAGEDFEEQDIAPPGGSVEQPWLSVADIDGDGRNELLLAQKNFLRAVALKPEIPAPGSTNKVPWVFSVKEQINGAASNSKLVGAAAVTNGTNAVPSLFLLDAERKALTLCERDGSGVWQVVRNLPLPVSEFDRLQPVAFGGTALNSVAFLGRNLVAWMALAGDIWEFTEIDGYETPIKDGRLNDVVAGDLNNDGRKDLVFLESARNYLDFVLFDLNSKLVPLNRWQVFEERTFRSRRSDMIEPREAVVAELTGDGKNDLAVIVHDRIILYPQD